MSEDSLTKTSPDGRFRVDYDEREMRMSHWVKAPRVADLSTGRVIVDLQNDVWDAEVAWGEPGCFSLSVRRYPDGGHAVTAYFDVDAGTVRLGGGAQTHSLGRAENVLRDHFRDMVTSAPGP